MQILGNIFNAVIFVSAIGGIFCVLSLFMNHVLRFTMPLWSPLCGMMLFCFPLLSPEVFGSISSVAGDAGMVKGILYCLPDLGMRMRRSFYL